MTLPQMEGYNLMNLLQMKYYYIHVNVRRDLLCVEVSGVLWKLEV